MKISAVKIKNFRGYKDETNIKMGNLTAFVGKNDVGKSTILEALDIFFNDGDGVVKMDTKDVNVVQAQNGNTDIMIGVTFSDLPSRIVLDSEYETTLQNEYLLNQDNNLEVVKIFPNGGKAKVYVYAYHPTQEVCKDLLSKKEAELRKIISTNHIECGNLNINAVMREAIRSHFQTELAPAMTMIDVAKGDTKSIWEQLQVHFPAFALFQADRKNCDSDEEVQDPLKVAVKAALADEVLAAQLDQIAHRVVEQLQAVASLTLDKLREVDPAVASILSPDIPSVRALKWADVFKSVSISADDGIPINKRGSGVKRLLLMSFFRAEAERRMGSENASGIVYAIEEPETSQHFANQKILSAALQTLAQRPNVQVVITSHSSVFIKEIDPSKIRLVASDGINGKTVTNVQPGLLGYQSLNEVSYIAFDAVTEEYHNELYGWIEQNHLLDDYRNGRPRVQYNKLQNGQITTLSITQTEYIRHQIHHPENQHNPRFTLQQLQQSIVDMRAFILMHRS